MILFHPTLFIQHCAIWGHYLIAICSPLLTFFQDKSDQNAWFQNRHEKICRLVYHMNSLIKVEDFTLMTLVICNLTFKIWRRKVDFCYSKTYHMFEMKKPINFKLDLLLLPSQFWDGNFICDMNTKPMTVANDWQT